MANLPWAFEADAQGDVNASLPILFQIAALTWLFLGEPLSGRQLVGMLLAGLGTLIVQIR